MATCGRALPWEIMGRSTLFFAFHSSIWSFMKSWHTLAVIVEFSRKGSEKCYSIKSIAMISILFLLQKLPFDLNFVWLGQRKPNIRPSQDGLYIEIHHSAIANVASKSFPAFLYRSKSAWHAGILFLVLSSDSRWSTWLLQTLLCPNISFKIIRTVWRGIPLVVLIVRVLSLLISLKKSLMMVNRVSSWLLSLRSPPRLSWMFILPYLIWLTRC